MKKVEIRIYAHAAYGGKIKKMLKHSVLHSEIRIYAHAGLLVTI